MATNHKREEHVQRKRGEDEQNDRGRDLASNQLRNDAPKDLNELKIHIKMSFFWKLVINLKYVS